jgi:hypothetical protein
VGHVARKGERRGVYRYFVGKPEGKDLRGRPTYKWEDNIKIYIQDRVRWQALVNAVMSLWVP